MRPSHARPLTFRNLTRRAFVRAQDELMAAVRDGRIGARDAAIRLDRLATAYGQRKDALELRDFIDGHNLQRVFARNWAARMRVGKADGHKTDTTPNTTETPVHNRSAA